MIWIIMAINLQEFLDWYKRCEIELWDKKWLFREPKIKDIKLPILTLLEMYCIEWSWKEFKEIFEKELPLSKQKELLDKLLGDLGLA